MSFQKYSYPPHEGLSEIVREGGVLKIKISKGEEGWMQTNITHPMEYGDFLEQHNANDSIKTPLSIRSSPNCPVATIVIYVLVPAGLLQLFHLTSAAALVRSNRCFLRTICYVGCALQQIAPVQPLRQCVSFLFVPKHKLHLKQGLHIKVTWYLTCGMIS